MLKAFIFIDLSIIYALFINKYLIKCFFIIIIYLFFNKIIIIFFIIILL